MHMTMKSFFFSSKNTICVSACDTLDVDTKHAWYCALWIQNRNLEIETQLDKVKMDGKRAIDQGKPEPGHNIYASAEPVLLARPLVPPWRRLADEEEKMRNTSQKHKCTELCDGSIKNWEEREYENRTASMPSFGPESRCLWNPGLVISADHSRIYSKNEKSVEMSSWKILPESQSCLWHVTSKTT